MQNVDTGSIRNPKIVISHWLETPQEHQDTRLPVVAEEGERLR